MEQKQSNRRKTGLVAALLLCCVLAVGAGVMAWFSVTTSKTNNFVEGKGITEPDKKPDPDNPEQGGGDDNEQADAWLIETNWKDDSAITAGSIVPKNPNVGIGKRSQDAYVFVEVENNLGENAYFAIGDNWAPVTGKADEYVGQADATLTGKKGRLYTGGLFVYVGPDGNQSGTATEADMAMLQHDADGLKDKYTDELFDKVYANNDFVLTESKTIEVKAYLVAASANGEKIDTDEVITKAKDWAEHNTK